MSLTRKALSAMGIEEAQIDQIIEMHTGVVNEIKEERDKLKSDAERLPNVQKELDELKKEVAKQGDENPFKVKYEALKEDFDNYKKDIEKKETTAKKETAYKKLLKDAGVSEKRISSVLKVSKSGIDALEFGEDGTVKDADKIVEGIKEEWADFIETTSAKGAQTATPPAGGKATMSRDEIMQIKNRDERRKAIAENMEAFENKEGEN